MTEFLADVGLWMGSLGGWAYMAAPLVMAAVAVFPIPAEAPAMVNGALFGPLVGTLITWLGAFMGAWISFELARRFGRPLAERLVPARALAKSDRMVGQVGWLGLLGLRLVPFVAFTALNWGAGLTAMSRPRFLWTTALGIIPGALLFTVSGSRLPILLERAPNLAGVLAAVAATGWLIWWMLRRRASNRSPTA